MFREKRLAAAADIGFHAVFLHLKQFRPEVFKAGDAHHLHAIFSGHGPGRPNGAAVFTTHPACFLVSEIAVRAFSAVREEKYRWFLADHRFKRAVGHGNLVTVFQGNPEFRDLNFFKGLVQRNHEIEKIHTGDHDFFLFKE